MMNFFKFSIFFFLESDKVVLDQIPVLYFFPLFLVVEIMIFSIYYFLNITPALSSKCLL